VNGCLIVKKLWMGHPVFGRSIEKWETNPMGQSRDEQRIEFLRTLMVGDVHRIKQDVRRLKRISSSECTEVGVAERIREVDAFKRWSQNCEISQIYN
jgi:hypothetical protein